MTRRVLNKQMQNDQIHKSGVYFDQVEHVFISRTYLL